MAGFPAIFVSQPGLRGGAYSRPTTDPREMRDPMEPLPDRWGTRSGRRGSSMHRGFSKRPAVPSLVDTLGPIRFTRR